MKAVFSFWTRPLAARFGAFGEFGDLSNFLRSWALSVQLAARHYNEIELVTDTPGRELLVGALELPFTAVSVALDEIPAHVPTFHWALSKLVAYAAQTAPFVHIDSDVYLWKRLPARLERAPLFAQNRESDVWSVHYYCEAHAAIMRHLAWLPAAFADDTHTRGTPPTAVNAGVLGGRDVDFFRKYAMSALELVLHPGNQAGWKRIGDIASKWKRFSINAVPVIVEQYLFHRHALHARKWPQVEFLFDEHEAFANAARSAALCRELGYTHLMSPQAKHDEQIMTRLAQRLTTAFPASAARIGTFAQEHRARPALAPFFRAP